MFKSNDMKYEYYGNSNSGGVYKITNIVNGKVYIGSAKEFKKRSTHHCSKLKNNKHHNKHLLYAFKKYGEENFLFEVVFGKRKTHCKWTIAHI